MNLLDFVNLAEIAYTKNSDEMVKRVNSLVSSNAKTIPVYVEKTDTEAFVCRYNKSLVIGFSGTESIRDLWQDLKFHPVEYKGGKIHAGFKGVFNQIKEPLNDAINELFPISYIEKIDVVGHSLGGAIAIGAIDLIKIPYISASVTTFGCPKGWSRNLANKFESQYLIFNYRNFCDYVTYLLNFTHRPGYTFNIYGTPGHKISKYRKAIEKGNYK